MRRIFGISEASRRPFAAHRVRRIKPRRRSTLRRCCCCRPTPVRSTLRGNNFRGADSDSIPRASDNDHAMPGDREKLPLRHDEPFRDKAARGEARSPRLMAPSTSKRLGAFDCFVVASVRQRVVGGIGPGGRFQTRDMRRGPTRGVVARCLQQRSRAGLRRRQRRPAHRRFECGGSLALRGASWLLNAVEHAAI